MRVKGILLGSSFFDVCSEVSRSISLARCLPVVTAESGFSKKKTTTTNKQTQQKTKTKKRGVVTTNVH